MGEKYTDFREVPQYMGDASYTVHADMRYMPRELYRWYNDETVLALDFPDEEAFAFRIPVPDFQRGHVWSVEQQSAFIEHMLRGGDGGILRFNHPNWPVGEGALEIVDGLQRATAVLRFQRNEIPAFGSYRREYSGHPDTLRSRFQLQVNTLKTRSEVLRWYLELNATGTPHREKELRGVRQMMHFARLEEGVVPEPKYPHTENPRWGFYGTWDRSTFTAIEAIRPEEAWETVFRVAPRLTDHGAEWLQRRLDSTAGRHFADALYDLIADGDTSLEDGIEALFAKFFLGPQK